MNINGRSIWRQLKYLHILPRLVLANENDKLAWWAAHSEALSHWAAPGKEALLQQPSAQGLEGYLRITRDLLKIQHGIRETLTGYGIRQNLGTIYRIS